MDIMASNLPSHATNKHLKNFFSGPLADCGVKVYHVEKMGSNPMAIITALDANAAQEFLSRYGVPADAPRGAKAAQRLNWGGQFIRCFKSRNEPSEFSLRSLVDQASVSSHAAKGIPPQKSDKKEQSATRFDVRNLSCGMWDYDDEPFSARSRGASTSQLLFVPHFSLDGQGTILFGVRQVIILLGPQGSDQHRIDINYHDCLDIVMGSYEEPSISFNLRFPPKIYGVKAVDLVSALQRLFVNSPAPKLHPPKKERQVAIDNDHAKVAGSCFVYRVMLSDFRQLASVRSVISRNRNMCSVVATKTKTRLPQHSLGVTFVRLNHELTDLRLFGGLPWELKYQVERLARNGRLSPTKVLGLLPTFRRVFQAHGLNPTLHAARRLNLQIPAAGPDTQAEEFSTSALAKDLEELADGYDSNAPDNPYELAKRHKHTNLIHKVVVTPAGTYLTGPEPEPTNRVLRRYAMHPNYFLRFVFLDEDRAAVRYDSRTDQGIIFHERFKRVLDEGVVIAGRKFYFLGFSHSSLRSQSCWFMAPLIRGLEMAYPIQILKELGDFSTIRAPARCAARIGQNFTDTNATVDLHHMQVGELPVVERSGRDFSDGVGTISLELLQRVWRVYGTRRLLKPTALQIRFQGAKGMVSLDSRLPGSRLMLRSNMKKFETEASWTLEICGAGFRPLPMILNRQFIKIFEDLGVPMSVFMDLQSTAIKWLRQMTLSSINTATLLEQSEGTKATNVPSLVRHLGQIGLDYHQDDFLYSVVEMAVLSKVRDIKYRGRIPVEQGVTLYGIMDETGFLREGEVFVVTEKAPEGGKHVLVRDNVIVTRSPAMHPGDIQVANAVSVPDTSPLMRLANVVVFSQHGVRDLPSQLSGGDLDGDVYNVIWDPLLIPQMVQPAADYPRVPPVELDRTVTSQDMSDFFVTFMESDQLGLICNMHLQLADQCPDGTLDAKCIKLAGMASTAVDFSKTGIPVNMREAPKAAHLKPDFMAPSPRVVVSELGDLELEVQENEDDEAFEGIDSERRPMRYYSSHKTLGHLFRAIDENMFLANMQREHRVQASPAKEALMTKLLGYVKHYATQYGVIYKHHLPLGSEIRASYEESLVDLIYNYEPSPHMPLSEQEVFAGTILGRQGGAQGRDLRDLSRTMRERFETVVEYAKMRIVKGDQIMQQTADLDELYDTHYDDREFEALPRAIACLEVAITQPGYQERRIGELKSFRYVAAGVCLKELERYRITTFGSYSGLPQMPAQASR